MSTAYVTSKTDSHITSIEFFHPSHNSLPGNLLSKLVDAIASAGQDPETRVIILRSGGDRTFCAGASFEELVAVNDEKTGELFFSGFANVINAMRKCPKLIIGRVQGKTVGGGVGIASATDYCFATKYASIKLSELHIGIGPFVIGPAVQRKMGVSAFSQMAINATEFYTPEWAQQQGLFASTHESTAAMDTAVQELAEKLATYNPEAATEMKKMFWTGCDDWDELLKERAQTSGKLVLSEFTKKSLQKFK